MCFLIKWTLDSWLMNTSWRSSYFHTPNLNSFVNVFLRQNKSITIPMFIIPHNKTFYFCFTDRAVFIAKSLCNIMTILLSCLFIWGFLKRMIRGAHNYIGLYCLTLCIIMILQFSTFYQNYIEKRNLIKKIQQILLGQYNTCIE